MNHLYHVQREVTAYYRHIPHVPDDFPVDPNLLGFMEEAEFRYAFKELAERVGQVYRDMEENPSSYGVPLSDIHEVNENKEDGNLAKASWRSVKRLGDVLQAIGSLGVLDGDGLRIPLADFRQTLKKMTRFQLILDRLIDFGFAIEEYDGAKFRKDAAFFVVSYPDNPRLPSVLKAYALSPGFHADDPHEFYYMDYKRVADRDKLPSNAAALDLAALLDEDHGLLLILLHEHFVGSMGLSAHYKDDSLEYFQKKKRVARFMIDFHTGDVMVILKLKDMDAYGLVIDSLPPELRTYFEKGNCRYCDFQQATAEWCKFRLSWTIDDCRQEGCGFDNFNFINPGSRSYASFARLMELEYSR
ncbi:hypothetical protein [Gorillibacterium timonense]|uniref:hypothetical protein n=1 Tax=Gorillibacterium timonense TaxID=1689269 RepID=UPI00071C7224|nr:hypothetical protein [Gorillibacterium timonense]